MEQPIPATQESSASNLPKCDIERLRCLSGSTLKLFAVIVMLIDHVGRHIVRYTDVGNQALLTIRHHTVTLSSLMTGIGRMAFPIFAFLVVEGYQHTRSKKRYGRNLLLFAFISEIPWNLVHANSFLFGRQNVFFTLFLGYLGICCINRYMDDWKKETVSLLLLLAVAYFLRTDYGCTGYTFILMLYFLRERKLYMSLAGSFFLPGAWRAGLAFIPICMYNGQRGFVKGKVLKYAFYAFYPVHLLVIYFIKLHLFGG